MKKVVISKLSINTPFVIEAPEVVHADCTDVSGTAVLTANGRRAIAKARIR